MPPEVARSLLDRRLVVVTGKGGTGKTTVSAALAVAGARAGLRVLVAETGRDEQVPQLLAPGSPAVGYAGAEVHPGVRAMRIDPFEALAEYLGLQLGVRSLVDLVLRNRGFRQLMSAAPGWRELITLGKVWHLEQMRDGERPIYDLIVVDAPATGHGVTFLDAPRVVVSAVRAGPLRRHALLVEQLIEDPARCVLLPVALAEELPARETAELVERLRAPVGIAVDRVVVTGVRAPPVPEALGDVEGELRRLAAPAAGAFPPPAQLAHCVAYLRARAELNRGYVAEIARSTALPTVCLPFLTQGIGGLAELELLAEALLEKPEAGPA